ncbi:MAG: beta-N-acetylhexosaminidase [Bacteroidia bacterium]|nr:beta-N-acetylhexosaminidase [Bacteroidia bacterium]
MKSIISGIVIFLVFAFKAESQNCSVIPCPQKVEILEGEFTFINDTRIIAPGSLNITAELFSEEIKDLLGRKIVVTSKGSASGNIVLQIEKTIPHPEGYELKVSSGKIEVKASGIGGIFYGLQSLKQLLICSDKGILKAQVITDSPRFEWRGVMLDVSRTFMPVNLVKRYIDLFAMYKLNVVHLHLTDDQGWRIQIKKYPLLTESGSKFDPRFNTMGGYYSHDDIRDLVKYAQQRNVMLVPEIEMPGHASAAIASYPDLSCEGVRPVIHTFFEGKSIHDEIFCAGKESTYEMIFGIIDELCELFPSPYIHIGGDEAPKSKWEKCPYCQKAMKDNNLNNEEELQSYFVKRIGDYLRDKNKTLVGWDEIIDGGKLAGDEVLMFWRGWKLSEVEKEVNLGVQANFWSHIDRSEHNIDKQLFPRILGLAETAWSIPSVRNWDRFIYAAAENISYLKKSKNVNVYNDSVLVKQ